MGKQGPSNGAMADPNMPLSGSAAQEGLSLPPENSAEFVSVVTAPAGTRIQIGVAAEGFAYGGEGVQVELLQPIPGSCYGPGVPLNH